MAANRLPLIHCFGKDEDWSFRIEVVDAAGAAVDLSGKNYRIDILKGGVGSALVTLDTGGTGLTRAANVLTGSVAVSVSGAWDAPAEYAADLIWYGGGATQRMAIMDVQHVRPGRHIAGAARGSVRIVVDAATLAATGEVAVLYTGPAGPAWGAAPVAWSTGLVCVATGAATIVTYNGSTYRCNTAHTAGATFAADAAKWTEIAVGGNTILTVSGVPSSGTGKNGDYAFNPATLTFYGPKASGVWPGGKYMTGPGQQVKVPNVKGTIIWTNSFETLGASSPGWASYTNCTATLDTTNVAAGVASLSMVNTGNPNPDCVARITGINIDLSAANAALDFQFYIPPESVAKSALLYIAILDGAGANRGYYVRVAATGRAGLCSVSMPMSQYSYQSGSINMAAIVSVRIANTPVTNQICTIVADRLTFFTPKASEKGRIIIGIDGTPTYIVAAARALAKRNVRGTFFTNENYLDRSGYISTAELKAIARQGHFIGCYGGSYKDPSDNYYPAWASCNDAQKLDIVTRAQAWAYSNGFYEGARSFSPSGTGGWSDSDEANLLGRYLDFVAMMDCDGSGAKHLSYTGPKCVLSWFNGKSGAQDQRPSSETFTTLCAKAVATGTVLTFGSHLNGDVTAYGTDNQATFEANVDIALAAGLDVVTPADIVY